MPSGLISLDSDSEKLSTPNFAAAYGAGPAGPMLDGVVHPPFRTITSFRINHLESIFGFVQ